MRQGAKDLLGRAARNRRWVPVRVIAGFAGLAQSVQPTLPLARLYLRGLFDVIKTKRCWESDVRLSKQALRDLQWWTEISEKFTKRAIFRAATTATLFSDASMRARGGAYNQQVICHGMWNVQEREQHITELELLAVLCNVIALKDRLRHRRVLLLEDNAAVVWIFWNKTTRQPRMMAILRDLVATLDLNDTELDVRYVRTNANLADAPSRFRGRDFWKLRQEVFRSVERCFGLRHTVDRFASAATTVLPRYNAPHPEHGAEAIDALAQPWLHEVNWLHPPPDLLLQVTTRLQREDLVRGTLVTPYWPAEAWFQTMRTVAHHAVVVPSASLLV